MAKPKNSSDGAFLVTAGSLIANALQLISSGKKDEEMRQLRVVATELGHQLDVAKGQHEHVLVAGRQKDVRIAALEAENASLRSENATLKAKRTVLEAAAKR